MQTQGWGVFCVMWHRDAKENVTDNAWSAAYSSLFCESAGAYRHKGVNERPQNRDRGNGSCKLKSKKAQSVALQRPRACASETKPCGWVLQRIAQCAR